MDFTNMTFAGLATIGVVNVVSFFKPELDSKYKFAISLIAAFAFLFVPAEVGNMLYDKAVEALKIAFAASGAYKVAMKAGGN